MSAGDPIWTCPSCHKTYYSNIQTVCCGNVVYGLVGNTYQLPQLPQSNVGYPVRETLVVCLYGGPGSGKSTTAAGVFHDLKIKGIDCELVTEFAKKLVWAKRHHTFNDQIYLFAKQYHSIFNVLGQVQVIVTDCPILLSPIYDIEKRPTLEQLIVEEHNKMWSYNVFLKRTKKYNPNGRNQTEEESIKIDGEILDLLDKHKQAYETFEGNSDGKDGIVKKITWLLKYKNNERVNI